MDYTRECGLPQQFWVSSSLSSSPTRVLYAHVNSDRQRALSLDAETLLAGETASERDEMQ